jgi:hypothetical protein
MATKKPSYTVDFLYRPGLTMSELEIEALHQEFRRVAVTCFDEVPTYQCLLPGREALKDKVITVARREDGTMAGFCSAVLLPVKGMGDVFHLGLTCVHSSARGHGLTHALTSKLLLQYVFKYRPFGRIWFSNVACVLSSLGNVALNFDSVFPSPYGASQPTNQHLAIAEAIDRYHRSVMAVNEDAVFCPHTFVFRGSVTDTTFAKQADDTRYHHRKPALNRFYMDLLNFEAGDEVLQIGHFSALSLLRYFLRPGAKKASTAAAELLAAAGR